MTTQIDSRREHEAKHDDQRSNKDDFKQQSARLKNQTKQDVPVDAGTSLVGGTIQAVQNAAVGALHMLPQSVQTQATNLQTRAVELTKPVADSYAHDGLLAAAKTASGFGAGAVSTLGTQATTKATSLVGAPKEEAAPVEAKKHSRRRRGGRGHGNRKLKTRLLPEAKVESIADTLGEKAAELKQVTIEALPEKRAGSKDSAPGIIGAIRNTAQGIVDSATSTASGLMAGASSTASGLMAGASSTASGLVSGAQEKIQSTLGSNSGVKDVKGSKKASLKRKPTLERRDELPSLGTPNTPGDAPQKQLPREAPAEAAPTTLLGKASAMVDSAKSYVADKLDQMSMNADDDGELENVSKTNDSILDKAKISLDKMADSISNAGEAPVEQKKEEKKEKQ